MTPIRPLSPAITSGKTALPTLAGVIRALGDQQLPGVPPEAGLLQAAIWLSDGALPNRLSAGGGIVSR